MFNLRPISGTFVCIDVYERENTYKPSKLIADFILQVTLNIWFKFRSYSESFNKFLMSKCAPGNLCQFDISKAFNIELEIEIKM